MHTDVLVWVEFLLSYRLSCNAHCDTSLLLLSTTTKVTWSSYEEASRYRFGSCTFMDCGSSLAVEPALTFCTMNGSLTIGKDLSAKHLCLLKSPGRLKVCWHTEQ